MKRLTVYLACMWCVIQFVFSQNRNNHYENYIEMYKDLAITEMEKHHIPASITLAQGLLESSAGRSKLSRYFNNHFGIKCGRTWEGKKTYHNDDRPNECFREYDHPRQSFEDHSLFLMKNGRYAFLFQLDMKDYKGWAHGLKKAGYATNPRYGNILVSLIERYELYRFDQEYAKSIDVDSKIIQRQKGKKQSEGVSSGLHQAYIANGLVYIVVNNGDSWESISNELGISIRKLQKYNDLYKGYSLKEGDVLYLKQKNKKGPKGTFSHILREGESMYSVSQKYGIRLKNLYKLNRMSEDSPAPKVGEVLRVR